MNEPLDPIAARWKEALLEVVEPHKHLPLLLSGGMDSTTILAAQLELGARPRCYGYKLSGPDSIDVKAAKRICADHNLEYDLTEISRDQSVLIEDIKTAILMLGTTRKAAIQCSIPIMYMAKKIARWSDQAIVGTGAIVMDDRTVSVIWRSEGEEAARNYRASKYEDRHIPVGTGYMHKMAQLCGVFLQEPLSDEPLQSVALSIDFQEMNKPKQKGIALRAFPDFFREGGYWRANSSLQVNSGYRAFHDTLLNSEYNKRGSRRVLAIYNDIRDEILSKGYELPDLFKEQS